MAYDVFISFKNSGKDGLPTPDAVAARKVYEALKGQNIKTFFSEESLAEEGRGHFSKSIEVALEASRVLILVASCREHIESQWVEAEWDSFSQDVRSGNKQGELFIYNCGDLKPNNLPLFLRRQQMFQEQGLEKMIKFVSSAIPSIPTLDNHIHLALHCFHPEKNEDKVYLITVQKGTNADTYNVTAHWGARSSKRLSSQIKAVNVTDEKAKAEIEKARLEKVRGGYAAAAHAKLLTDDARSFLSASLGLTDVPAMKPQAAPTSDVPKKKNAKVEKSPVVSAPVKSAKAVKAAPVSPVKVLKSPKPVVQAKAPVKTVQEAAAPAKVVKPSTSAPTKVMKAQKPAAPTKVAPKGKAPVVAKTVCISGKLPSGKKKADYEAPLRAAGYELVDDVVKGLSLLVLADPTVVSSKSEKAKKLGVKVISETQLAKLAR